MENFPLSSQWVWKTLGEIAEIKGRIGWRGLKKSEYTNEGPILLSIGNISEFGIDFENVDHLTWERYRESPEIIIQPGDIIIAKDGTLGKVALVKSIPYETTISSTLAKIRPNPEVDPAYLYYYMRSDYFQAQVIGSRTGTAVQHFVQKNMKLARIPVPTLATQKCIAGILERAHRLLIKREQANQLTGKIIRSVFLKMFGDPATNPKRWPVHRLVELAELRGGIQLSKQRRPKNFPRPYLTIRNVYSGRLDLSDVRYIEVPDNQLERWILKPGDLLVLEGGDRDDVGRTAMFRGELRNCVHQNHVFRVRVNKDLLVPEYLMHYLNSDHVKSQFFMLAKATTGINSINMTQLKSVGVLCPPIAIQEHFAHFVERVALLNGRQIQSATEINEFFHSLMRKAFSGELSRGILEEA
jgi:type I restriction enzyme S subunit